MIFRYTQYLIWWYLISICLDLSWNIVLIESLMQLWLSQCITIGSKCEPNKLTRIFLIQIASHTSWIAAMYYASTELSAKDLCFLLYEETVVDRILETPPDVLFLSVGLPTQSVSMKPCNFTSSIYLYHKPYSNVPLRYHRTCFPAFQKSLVGLTIAWLSWFTAYHIPGLVFTVHWQTH